MIDIALFLMFWIYMVMVSMLDVANFVMAR